jgi:hypothetical protein
MDERDFLELLEAETGLDLDDDDLRLRFDEIGGWNSIFMLMLAGGYLRATGVRLEIPKMFEADTPHGLWRQCIAPRGTRRQ